MSNKLNYSVWKNHYQTILSDFPNKNIVLAYSGGKDSSVVLHLMNQAQKDIGFHMEVHGVVFPNHVLTKDEQDRLKQYWRKNDVDVKWHTTSIDEGKLSEAAQKGESPCRVCNKAKKKVLINYFKEMQLDFHSTVIVMSYSLWDLVSATVEHILGSIYSSDDINNNDIRQRLNNRFNEISQRFYPLITLRDGLTIFKPLIHYNDQHILNYLSERKIPVVSNKCEYKDYRPKRWFANYYHNAGLEFEYEKVHSFAQKALALPDITYYENVETGNYFNKMI